MSENLTPVKAESALAGVESENLKSKKKKKAIGAFVVEADPSDQTKSFWKGSKPSKETNPIISGPETETIAEKLTETETKEALQQLAAARRLELDNPNFDAQSTSEELEAAKEYLTAVQATGELEVGIVEYPEESIESVDQPTSEAVIDTDNESEGEILLAPGVGNGQGNQPPKTPDYSREEPNEPQEPLRPFSSAIGPSEAMVSANVAGVNERRAQTDGLIVGGIVGYLLGRRRGRIKTEKKLLPVQRGLEKQVKRLHNELLNQEYQVRAKANKISAIVSSEKSKLNAESEVKSTSAVASTERIGHVLVAATSLGEKASFSREVKVSKSESDAAKQKVANLDRSELLAVSQTIMVEGTSLRQIYETQLLSEKGLRRLVTEHFRGGNISRALKRELIERQIDFERDPVLRDQSNKSGADNAGKTALAVMLSRVGLSESSQAETIGSKKSNKSNDAVSQQKTGPQNLIDTALAGLIGFLLLVILTLLFRS